MSYVLFSPIGNTDPIRGGYDGSWLHICRHYQPRATVIYLSAMMCQKEDSMETDGTRKDLYARTLHLLNQHLYGDQTERYIQLISKRDPECENAHSLEIFYPVFQKILSEMRRDYPDDEILVNASSGTAGMKGALMAVSTLLPFRVHIIQISDPSNGDSNKSEIVGLDYLVEESFICDEDNKPGAVNRTSEQPMNNLVLGMRINELCRLVEEGDYHTALQEVKSESLKNLVSYTALKAIEGAVARSHMKLEAAGKAFQTSGFALGASLRKHAEEPLWQCAEYLLTMEYDLKSGAYDNFIRKLTPLLTRLCELYLASIGKDVRQNGVNGDGKWERENIPAEWLNELDNAFGYFKDRPLAVANMKPLIVKYGDARTSERVEALREVEEKVRHKLAHEIVPFGRGDIEGELKKTGQNGIKTPERIVGSLRELLEMISPSGSFDADYWRSYEAMNVHICLLIRDEGASKT